MTLLALPALADNYIWLLADTGGTALVVDPGESAPVETALAATGLRLTTILLTHHHLDHIGAAAALATRHGATIHAPRDERIADADVRVGDGDRIELAAPAFSFDVIAIPGHTLSHVAYHGHGLLFCGDTLFSIGCGRLFEGTPAQMLASLHKLAALPAATRVCCTHEYTLSNLNFAQAVEPHNADLADYRQQCEALRARGEPTLPSSIALEARINPFLRARERAVAQAAHARDGADENDEVAVFASLRQWKNEFR